MSDAEPDQYMSLTHIGWEWDVSNRALGQALEQAGYWSGGTPTTKALDEGLAVRKSGSGYAWSRDGVNNFILTSGCSERFTPKNRQMFLVTPMVIR